MAKAKYEYDLIVIGGGAAGSVAAEIVARAGKRVAIIEQNTFGGTTATLDLPLAALTKSAHELANVRRGAAFGLRVSTVGYNFPSIRNYQNVVLKRSGMADSEQYYRTLHIDVFKNRAHFLSDHEISIGRRHITAEKFLLATGARMADTEIQGLDRVDVLTPETILHLSRPPKSLFVIGAGWLGAQLAQNFAIFGSKTYLADARKRILPAFDEEVSELFSELFQRNFGMEILTSARVVSVVPDGPLTRVTFLRGERETSVKVEKVLLAAGRSPNVDLGLENAGVEFSGEGISVNENLLTSAKHIWAAGDVLGGPTGTHVAIMEARAAAANILGGKIVPNYDNLPQVFSLLPEIAIVGLDENVLTRRDEKFRKHLAKNNSIARANISNDGQGFAKILADPRGLLLGGTIVGPSAGETIQELSLALQQQLNIRDIAELRHDFNSWAEVVRLAAAK
jgi:dihydrolipoamide dehydrogenase